MVAPFDFFQLGEMRIQLGLASERTCRRSAAAWGCARRHANRRPPCVRSLNAPDMARRRQMRSAAEIDEVALRISGNRFSIRKAFDQLHLVMLPASFEKTPMASCFVNFASGDGKIAFHDFVRACLDFFEILRRKRPIEGKVIIETVFQSRADRQLGGREKVLSRLAP